jgi:hypothetical protein
VPGFGILRVNRELVTLAVILVFDAIFILTIASGILGIIFFPNGSNFRPFATPQNGFDLIISAWVPTNFGTPNIIPSLPIFVISLLQMITGSPLVAQILLFFSPYLISGLSMWLLLTRGLRLRSGLAIVAGGIVYTVNWVSILEIGDLTLLYVYASLPLVLFFSLRIFSKEGNCTRNAIGFGVALFIGTLASLLAGLVFLLPSILVILFFALFDWRQKSYIKGLVKSVFFSFLGLIVYIGLSLPFTLPSLLGILTQGVIGFSSTAGFHVQQDYLQYVHPVIFQMYLLAKISPFLLLTNPTNDIGISLVAVLIPLIAFASLLSDDIRIRRFATSVSLVFAIFLSLVYLIINQNPAIDFLYGRIIFLVPINGFEPYAIILGSLLGVLFPIGLDAIITNAKKHGLGLGRNIGNFQKSVYIALLLALILSATLPVLSNGFIPNNITHINSYESSLGPQFGSLPDYIPNLTKYFESMPQDNGPFRVLYVPQNDMVNQLLLTYDPSSDFQPGGLRSYTGLIDSLQNLTNEMTNPVGNSTNDNLSVSLAELGFRYVVVLRDQISGGSINMDMSGTDAYISGNPSLFIASLDNSKGISLIEENQYYAIFRISHLEIAPPSIFFLSSNLKGEQSNNTISQVSVLSKSPVNSPSQYTLNVTSTGPVWLVFADNFDPSWNGGVLQKGGIQNESHEQAMGWANAFYIPGNGSRIVELSYAGQNDHNLILYVWPLLIVIVTAIVLVPWIRRRLTQGKNS